MRYIYKNSKLFSWQHIIALAIMCCFMSGHEATARRLSQDTATTIFSERIYFQWSSSHVNPDYIGNRQKLDNIRQFLETRDTIGSNRLRLGIRGSASPEGEGPFNEELAFERAFSLMRYLGMTNISMNGKVINEPDRRKWSSCRYAEITAVTDHGTDNMAFLSTGECESDENIDTENILSETGRICNEEHAGCSHTQFSDCETHIENTKDEAHRGVRLIMGTNLLYDAALTPNIGIGICIGNKVTLWADYMHAWWSNHEKRKYWRIYGGDFEVRMQLGHGRSSNPLSGHRIGIYGSIVTYDFQRGRAHSGIIADKYNYAAGVSYGYSLPVARRLNIDFSIGVGYMWGRYLKHRLIDTHDVWQSTHNRRWIGPTKAEISLVWLIGRGNVNEPKKKGGRK